MTVYKEFRIGNGPSGRGNGPLGGLGGLLGLAVFLVIGYFLFKGLFTILSYIAPVLIIITAIIDYTVITDYGKFLLKSLKENPLIGILGVVLTIIAFPFVTGFLFFRAYMRRVLRKSQSEPQEKYTTYEEIKDEEMYSEYEEVQELDLEDIEIEYPKSVKNDYDQMF